VICYLANRHGDIVVVLISSDLYFAYDIGMPERGSGMNLMFYGSTFVSIGLTFVSKSVYMQTTNFVPVIKT
jgi:hypothetical protein